MHYETNKHISSDINVLYDEKINIIANKILDTEKFISNDSIIAGGFATFLYHLHKTDESIKDEFIELLNSPYRLASANFIRTFRLTSMPSWQMTPGVNQKIQEVLRMHISDIDIFSLNVDKSTLERIKTLKNEYNILISYRSKIHNIYTHQIYKNKNKKSFSPVALESLTFELKKYSSEEYANIALYYNIPLYDESSPLTEDNVKRLLLLASDAEKIIFNNMLKLLMPVPPLGCNVKITENTITILLPNLRISYIDSFSHNSINSLLNSFDINLCKVAYDGKLIYASNLMIDDYEKQNISYTLRDGPGQYRVSTINRVCKYYFRYLFSMQSTDLLLSTIIDELENINETSSVSNTPEDSNKYIAGNKTIDYKNLYYIMQMSHNIILLLRLASIISSNDKMSHLKPVINERIQNISRC
jgi:hypothetical protein